MGLRPSHYQPTTLVSRARRHLDHLLTTQRGAPRHDLGKRFLLPVRVLSRLFRRKFIAYLRAAFGRGALGFHGKLETLAESRNWNRLLRDLEAHDWVVYAKPPFGGPTQVLQVSGPLHPSCGHL